MLCQILISAAHIDEGYLSVCPKIAKRQHRLCSYSRHLKSFLSVTVKIQSHHYMRLAFYWQGRSFFLVIKYFILFRLLGLYKGRRILTNFTHRVHIINFNLTLAINRSRHDRCLTKHLDFDKSAHKLRKKTQLCRSTYDIDVHFSSPTRSLEK